MKQHAQAHDSLETHAFRTEPVPSDIAAIRNILVDSAVFTDSEIEIAEELIEDRLTKGARSEYHFVFALAQGAVEGYVCYGPITLTQNRADVYWIAVDAKAQHKGLGTALLKRAETRLTSLGSRRVFIETSSRDAYKKARFFYRKNGYRVVSHVPDFYADGDDKVIFMKILAY